MAYPSYDLGEDFVLSDYINNVDHTFQDVVRDYGDLMEVKSEGYGVDKRFSNICYIPENAKVELRHQRIRWDKDGIEQSIRLVPNTTYIVPSGYKVSMVRRSV